MGGGANDTRERAAGFGQCITCGNAVERVGWDNECFGCQDDDFGVDEAFEHDACGCKECQQALAAAAVSRNATYRDGHE